MYGIGADIFIAGAGVGDRKGILGGEDWNSIFASITESSERLRRLSLLDHVRRSLVGDGEEEDIEEISSELFRVARTCVVANLLVLLSRRCIPFTACCGLESPNNGLDASRLLASNARCLALARPVKFSSEWFPLLDLLPCGSGLLSVFS